MLKICVNTKIKFSSDIEDIFPMSVSILFNISVELDVSNYFIFKFVI